MNPIETTLKRLADNKPLLRAELRCKWTPFFLQREHFITTIILLPDRSPLQVRLQIVKKLLAITFILISVQTEEVANYFVILKISKTLVK